jgi:hypothetical protein
MLESLKSEVSGLKTQISNLTLTESPEEEPKAESRKLKAESWV